MAGKVTIVWTAPALDDLDEIADYIAVDNQQAAERLVDKVYTAVSRLTQHPNIGRKVPELPNLPYRELVVSPCRILYRLEDGKAYIVLITRGEMLLEEHRLWR
jgi:toxin ParE1/3/4